jgi:hypothetical protein
MHQPFHGSRRADPTAAGPPPRRRRTRRRSELGARAGGLFKFFVRPVLRTIALRVYRAGAVRLLSESAPAPHANHCLFAFDIRSARKPWVGPVGVGVKVRVIVRLCIPPSPLEDRRPEIPGPGSAEWKGALQSLSCVFTSYNLQGQAYLVQTSCSTPGAVSVYKCSLIALSLLSIPSSC